MSEQNCPHITSASHSVRVRASSPLFSLQVTQWSCSLTLKIIGTIKSAVSSFILLTDSEPQEEQKVLEQYFGWLHINANFYLALCSIVSITESHQNSSCSCSNSYLHAVDCLFYLYFFFCGFAEMGMNGRNSKTFGNHCCMILGTVFL